MGTLNIQATGFAALPAAVMNSFTTYSDADFQSTLNWGKYAFNAWIQQTYNPTHSPTFQPTNTQIWNAIVQNAFVATLISGAASYGRINPTPPPPIVIGP